MRARAIRFGGMSLLVCALVWSGPLRGDDDVFVRGDANRDGTIDIADPISMLRYFFMGVGPAECLDAYDANDDGMLNIADAVYMLSYLFAARAEPPFPFRESGHDPTPDSIPCNVYGVEGTFLSYIPKQCETDPWEAEPGDDVAAQVTAWIEAMGGVVKEARIEVWPFAVCAACGCPRGYTIGVVMTGDEVIAKLFEYGFMPVVP